MNLYQATLCRIVLNPVGSQYERVLIHAETPQSAGKLLKRIYPKWERVEWKQIASKPLLFRLP